MPHFVHPARVGIFLLALGAIASAGAQGTKADYERSAKLRALTQNKVAKARIQARWFDSGNRFWYRNDLEGGKREFILVDAVAGKRALAFDHARVAAALSKASGKPVAADQLPIDSLGFQGDRVLLSALGKTWECSLTTYEIKVTDIPPEIPSLTPLFRERPSRSGGEETEIVFDNRMEAEAFIYWVDTDGNRQAYGSVKAGQKRSIHTYAGHVWAVLDGPAGRLLGVFEATAAPGTALLPLDRPGGGARGGRTGRVGQGGPAREPGLSPDGRLVAFVKSNNVWLRDKATGQESPLSEDGKPGDTYGDEIVWSPDSKRIAALRTEPSQEHKVYYVESSPRDQLQPKLHSMDYLKPGDKVAHPRPQLFDVATRTQAKIAEALFPNPYELYGIRWAPDSSRFTFGYNQRGHQVLRILAVDAATGAVKPIVDETSKTFIDYSGKSFQEYLDATSELIWMSERDGWRHLYLYDLNSGQVKNQITKGEWVVRGVDRVDAEKRQIWFRAGGLVPGQDPYYVHFCRVNFDGTGLVDLTPGDGTHTMSASPDGRFYIDSYSRVDMPPVHELRRSEDGKLVCELEKSDASALLKTGWKMPERFVAKGRDGKTDIYGVIWRPTNFNPRKKYPVIESIYAGPQGSFTPKAWSPFFGQQELCELGFIVVQMDGMGTSDRSKAFHDVCFKNLGDAGFPDRILWMKAAATKYPSMDVTRVGIYGGSAGGQNALGAMLFHPEFYKAAAADCGCHDNRMDKIWWNEQWMGWPIGPEYAASSNVDNASKLQGKLLLMVGECDTNVDPASTMQVVNALIRAGKDFELIVFPGGGHGSGGSPYGARRQRDFFVRSLWGIEPRAK